MNWKEIKKKYPKAHDKAISYFCNNPSKEDLKRLYFCDTMIHTGNNDRWQVTFNIRYLYDFFDKQCIYVRIKTPFEHATVNTRSFLFGWFIQMPLNKSNNWCPKYIYEYYEETSKYKSRSKAEEVAFLKAFEILEELIKISLLRHSISQSTLPLLSY